jgi:hypothetical protein
MGGVPQNIPAARSTRRSRRARSTRPNGWARTTTRSSASTRLRRSTTTRLVGRWPAGRLLHQHQGLRGLSAENKAIIEAAAPRARRHAGQVRRPQPVALKQLVAQKTKLVLSRRTSWTPPSTSRWRCTRALREQPGWKKVYTDYATFRSDQNLWFRFTEASSIATCKRPSSEPQRRISRRPRMRGLFHSLASLRETWRGKPLVGMRRPLLESARHSAA